MKKSTLISLSFAAALSFAACSTEKGYVSDYEQIFLPTPQSSVSAENKVVDENLRFVLDEKTDIFDDAGAKIGEIYEGTPLKFIQEKDGKIQVSIKGHANGDELSFSESGEFLYLKSAAAKDEMSFWINSSSITANKADAFDGVETFYYDSCTSCHAAHHPKEHEMGEWDAYISAMQMNAKITDEQKNRILRFMQAHASDGQFKD